MAYDANKHAVFSQRTQNWVKGLLNIYQEAGALDDIYLNESINGTDPAWQDTSIATAAEHVDAITLMRRLRDALALDGQSNALSSEDQTARMTPFLQ